MKQEVEESIFKKKELARMLGIKPYTLSYYLTGRVRTPAHIAYNLGKILEAGRQIEADALKRVLSVPPPPSTL